MHEVVVPFGPQHPALLEPVHLRLTVDGEDVIGLQVRLGYTHKGLEKAFEQETWDKDIFLSERVCGFCGNLHQSCFCANVEKLFGIEIPERAKYVRTIMNELERIQSHLLWLGLFGHEFGLDTLFMYTVKDREHILDIIEKISGNRIHYAINRIGGVARDIPEDIHEKILKTMNYIKDRSNFYEKVFLHDLPIRRRIKKIGILTKKDAKELGVVGPIARGSGLKTDIRLDNYFAYKDIKFNVIVAEKGDSLSRTFVRINEIEESCKIITRCINQIPEGKLRSKGEIKTGESVFRVEAPRGELFYYIKSVGEKKPFRVKIRTPTYANINCLEKILIGHTIAEVPVIVASLDPCFSCCDRMTVIDHKTGKERIIEREYHD